METVEWVAILLSLAYVVLNGIQNIWCWPVGAASVAVYSYIFFDARLYADAGLQLIYLAFSLYGWITWKQMHTNNVTKPVLNLTIKLAGLFAALTLALFIGIYYVLVHYSDDSLPFWDALTAALSLTATFMNARKYIENWSVWILTNSLYIGIYWHKNLQLTAGLSLLMAALSVWSWVKWYREQKALV